MLHRPTPERSPLDWAALIAVMLAALGAVSEIVRPGLLPPLLVYVFIGAVLLVGMWRFRLQRQPAGDMPDVRPAAPAPRSLDPRHMISLVAFDEFSAAQATTAREERELIRSANDAMDALLGLAERMQAEARSLTHLAGETAAGSEEGQTAIQQAIEGMESIRAHVSIIATSIVQLAQLAQRIDPIISAVSEIATQSNLLALNASIEAARAGTHGRGFAVVADEVRTLSAQSTESARQVRAILGEIQAAIKQSMKATEDGLSGVDEGVQRTHQADAAMILLAANVGRAQQGVNQTYDIMRQQTERLDSISMAMERLSRLAANRETNTRVLEDATHALRRAILMPVDEDAGDDAKQRAG